MILLLFVKLQNLIPEVGSDISFTSGILNETLLHIATRRGHTNCMKCLIENNINVNCIGELMFYTYLVKIDCIFGITISLQYF